MMFSPNKAIKKTTEYTETDFRFLKTFISSILCVLMTCIYFFVERKEVSLKSAQRKDVFSFNVNEFLSVLCG